MWAVDSSWLFAVFYGADLHHGTARQEATESGTLFVNPAILMEFLDLVRRRIGREQSIQVLTALAATPTIRFVNAPKPAGITRVMSHQAGISWRDASAIATALDEGADLRTFDKTQRKAFEALR